MYDLLAHHLHQAVHSDLGSYAKSHPSIIITPSRLSSSLLISSFTCTIENPSDWYWTHLQSALAFLNSIVSSSPLNKSQLQQKSSVFSLLLSRDAWLMSATWMIQWLIVPSSEFAGKHANEEIRVLIATKFWDDIWKRNNTQSLVDKEDGVLSTVMWMNGLDGSWINVKVH